MVNDWDRKKTNYMLTKLQKNQQTFQNQIGNGRTT